MKRKKNLRKKLYFNRCWHRLILHFAAQRGPRFDTRFAIVAIRNIKKYNPNYILADRAYDTEPIRKYINEEAKAED